jgi:hypothetical protein
MKEIGNIHLCWRKGKGSVRIPVGIIKHNATGGVRFSYNNIGVKKAKEFGFEKYEGFPDTSVIYTENVLEIFGQRLIKSERSDTSDFYKFWNIDTKYKDDVFYMLAYTQGLLPTDNFEFLADFHPSPNLSFISEITGLTELPLPIETLKIGDKLSYKLEPENIYDKKAVGLYLNDKYLGHVKLIHSRIFHKVSHIIPIEVYDIEKNGVLKRVFIKIGL